MRKCPRNQAFCRQDGQPDRRYVESYITWKDTFFPARSAQMFGQFGFAINQVGEMGSEIFAAQGGFQSAQGVFDQTRLLGVEHADRGVDMDQYLRSRLLRAKQQQRDAARRVAARAKRRNLVAFDNPHRHAKTHLLFPMVSTLRRHCEERVGRSSRPSVY